MRTYRKTYFLYKERENKENAIDLLLALKVPFQSSKHHIEVLPKWVNKYDLELRLIPDYQFSQIVVK